MIKIILIRREFLLERFEREEERERVRGDWDGSRMNSDRTGKKLISGIESWRPGKENCTSMPDGKKIFFIDGKCSGVG
jgi:hypothetical protein